MTSSIKFFQRTLARNYVTQFFVPKHESAKVDDIEKVKNFLSDKPRILIVTGE